MRTAIEDLPAPPLGVKYIPLTQGKFAIVDEDDYEYLSRWKWCFHHYYANRNSPHVNGKRHLIYMHRVINNTPDGLDTDHRNGDKLDNRRCNLRTATRSENKRNQTKQNNNTSGFKGVSWDKIHRKFTAHIKLHGKQKTIGYFTTAEAANTAYREASNQLHGEFARI